MTHPTSRFTGDRRTTQIKKNASNGVAKIAPVRAGCEKLASGFSRQITRSSQQSIAFHAFGCFHRKRETGSDAFRAGLVKSALIRLRKTKKTRQKPGSRSRMN
jgi:hypothetical protein